MLEVETSKSRVTIVAILSVLLLSFLFSRPGSVHGQASSLALRVQLKAYAGRSVTVTVHALDANGRIDKAFSGNATVSLTGNALMHTGDSPNTQNTPTTHGTSATAILVNGVGTVVAHDAPVGETITFNASADGLASAAPVQVTFYWQDAARFQFADYNGNPIDSTTASVTQPGWRTGFYVKAFTELGDVATSFNQSASVSCVEANPDSTSSCDTTISFQNGESTVFAGDTEAEKLTVTVSASTITGQLVISFIDYSAVTRHSISGTVGTSDASTGAYGSAQVFPAGATDYGWQNVIASATITTGSAYTITNVPDGTYDIRFKVMGFLPYLAQGMVVSGADITSDVVLDRGNSISGNIFPVESEATIYAYDAATHEFVSSTTTTSEAASYSVTGLASGVYDLTVSADGYLPDEVSLVGIQVASNAVAPDVTLVKAGSISGTFTSATLSYVHLLLYRTGDRANPVASQHLYSGLSQGAPFSFSGLPGGSYDLTAKLGPMTHNLETNIQVALGVDSPNHNIVFNKSQGSINGTVTTSDGGSDTGEVKAYAAGADLNHPWNYVSMGSFTAGSPYSIAYNIWPGTYDIVFRSYSNDLALGVIRGVVVQDVEGGFNSDGNDIVLQRIDPGAILGVVRDAVTSDPIENIRVLAYSSDGFYFYADTDKTGQFKIRGLERGTYDLRLGVGGPHWMPGPSNYQPVFIEGLTVVNEGAGTGGLQFPLRNKVTVNLSSPANNVTVTTPTFTWEPVEGTYYLVVINRGYTGTSGTSYTYMGAFHPHWAFETTDTFVRFGNPSNGTLIAGSGATLEPGHLYTWEVFALRNPFDPSVKWEERSPVEVQAFGESDMRYFRRAELACTPGDINVDGRVDILDGARFARVLTSLEPQPSTEEDLCRYDLDASGLVDIVDVIDVLLKILGLP